MKNIDYTCEGDMQMAKVRELGIIIGDLKTGEKNCITDVAGVAVGHVTLDYSLEDGEHACTGVTAILPHSGNLFTQKVVGASYVVNGYGKTAGLVQVDELGLIESPIMLTNTMTVPEASAAAMEYMLEATADIAEDVGSINIVTGECNDGKLNSIRKRLVTKEHALEALNNAKTDTAGEGAVGAGKGMVCFGYKGGIGASSRLVPDGDKAYTLGVMVLSNFGRAEEFMYEKYGLKKSGLPSAEKPIDGSIMMVMATDAPLSDRQLKRVCKRCAIGLGRTGSNYSNGSGDVIIAFSTANKHAYKSEKTTESIMQMREDSPEFNMLFKAAAEATEEAILNSLCQAETTVGRKGNTVHKFDFDLIKRV